MVKAQPAQGDLDLHRVLQEDMAEAVVAVAVIEANVLLTLIKAAHTVAAAAAGQVLVVVVVRAVNPEERVEAVLFVLFGPGVRVYFLQLE